MGILMNIKRAAKKVVSKVGSAVKKAVSTFNPVAGAVANAYTAVTSAKKASSGGMNFPVGENVPKTVSAAQTGNYSGFNAPSKTTTTATPLNSRGGVGSTSYGPALPKTISSSSQKTSSGTSNTTSSYFNQSAFSGPITTSSLSAGGTTQGAVQGGGGVNAGATYSSSPYSVPTYSPTDPGNVNTTGLAGSMAGYYTRQDDGTFEPVTKDPFAEKSDADIAKEKAQIYKDAFGDPQNVYEDREVKRAMEQRRQAQEALLAPTAQLNAVLGQAQADTLRLRQTAQKEGVVEAVYGQQAAAINYNAAIAALPLQSNIAALQGNLDLADSYLNELVTMKKEQIKTQYEYNKGLFDTIYSALDAKEKRQADAMIKENDRQYKAEDELIDYKAGLIAAINSQGDTNSHVRITAVERAKDKVSAANAAGDLTSTKDRLANQKAQAELGDVASNVDVAGLPDIQKNTTVLENIFKNQKVSQGAKTTIGNGLALAQAAKDLADANPGGNFTGLSPFAAATDWATPNAFKRTATITNEGLINALDLQTQFWASGAALTDAQIESVNKLIPRKGDSDSVVKAKTNQIVNYMLSQTSSRLLTEGINFKPEKVDLFKVSPDEVANMDSVLTQ